ncbi:hypothetical protein RCO48_14550 [Peribacillus frigoritolerans]|nr:hypothetical protein [Peribacillus frigoritolerans]
MTAEKLKWAPAAFLPEYTKMLRDLDTDYHRQQKTDYRRVSI